MKLPFHSHYGNTRKNQPQSLAETNIAMRQRLKATQEKSPEKLTHKQQLPRKKIILERKKIRQLLRSMLPMEEDQRQVKEEQNLFH